MIIFAWIVLSLGGALIASRKQRSFWNFFLLGLALSPAVGIIAAMVAKPDAKLVQADNLATGQMRLCGQCRGLVKWSAARCSECDAALEAVSPPGRWNGIERRRAPRGILGIKRVISHTPSLTDSRSDIGQREPNY
jgi:hypothetical protein